MLVAGTDDSMIIHSIKGEGGLYEMGFKKRKLLYVKEFINHNSVLKFYCCFCFV